MGVLFCVLGLGEMWCCCKEKVGVLSILLLLGGVVWYVVYVG